MKNRKTFVSTVVIARVLITLAIACALCGRAVAQTAGGTVISNQASATYSDGTNSYSTVSNTVTVTVSNVSGLAITPDAGSNPTVVAGQTAVLFNFTVTNIGNFTDKVHFVPGSAHLSGTAPAAITRITAGAWIITPRARSSGLTPTRSSASSAKARSRSTISAAPSTEAPAEHPS